VVGTPVVIDAGASYTGYEPLGDSDAVSNFTAEWGDGTTNSFSATSNAAVCSHIYTSVGTYTVNVTATDGDTTSSATAIAFTVHPATPQSPGGSGDGNGVDLYSGAVNTSVDGPSSGGFGLGFDAGSSWGNDNTASLVGSINGNGTLQNSLPQLIHDGTNTLVLQSGGSSLWFDLVSGTWTERYGGTDTLTADSGNTQFIFADGSGTVTTFYDFSHGGLSGKIKGLSDANNNSTTYNYNGSSQLTSVVRENVTGTVHTKQGFTYNYFTSGANSGKISSIVLGNKTWDTGLSQSEPGSYSTVRQAIPSYYASGVSGGNAGDLELMQTEDAGSNVLDTQFFRYFVSGDSDTHGYVGPEKYVLNTDSYTRLVAALTGGTTPATATDAQVAPYADDY
jgi:YD repeat-containing protein